MHLSDILILGYYGFKNSGDDALLLSIIQQLRKQDSGLELCVLSQNPAETARIYKVKAVKRDNPIALIKALLSCKMLLVGGGTLVQDGTSTKSLLYYLYVIRFALMLGKKVMLYANGIGPLKEENHSLTRKILNRVQLITLRDKIAADELKSLGVTKPEIRLTADAAFGLDYDESRDISELLKKNGIPENKGYFCVAVRDNKNPDFATAMARVCDNISEKYGLYPVFMPFQKTKDNKITEEIRKKMKVESGLFDTECCISELLKFISGAEVLIGMRLHSLIYAAICRVPLMGLVYDPKVKGFMEYIGLESYADADNTDAAGLEKICVDCLDNSDKIKNRLEENYKIMRDKAEENAALAVRLLKVPPKGKK
jgi:polysaccharide pyruvyl transferase CsaB